MPARSRAPRRRVRRTPEEARRTILEAAEKRLIEGGPEAVRVQVVASDLGLSDAAIHHHFGSRQGLMTSLLREAGRRLRDEVGEILAGWDGDPSGLRRVAELIGDTYADRGYAHLALWLSLSGWDARGSGMFEPLVDALHRARLARARQSGAPRPRREESQHAVALLNLTLAAEPLMGAAFRRSVGLGGGADARVRFRRFSVETLERLMLSV